MGLFDRIFKSKSKSGKQPTPSPTKSKEKKYFLTNSHELGLGRIQLSNTNTLRIDAILAISELQKIGEQRGETCSYEVMYTSLLEEGALTVPVAFTLGQEKLSIYFIYGKEELQKFLSLTEIITQSDFPKLLYFSAIPIDNTIESKSIIEPFQLADLRYNEEAELSEKYAMWWHRTEDPLFHKSKTCEYLSNTYELVKGYETYLVSYVLRQTGVNKEKELSRIRLPEESAYFILDAPEGKKVIMDISQEKGIRFLFPVKTTTSTYRERFLRGAMVDIAANILGLRHHKAAQDEPLNPNSFDWFEMVSAAVRNREELEQLQDHMIGSIDFTNAQESPGIPPWSPFKDPSKHQNFIEAIQRFFDAKQVKFTIIDGAVHTQDEELGLGQMGLHNISHYCCNGDESEYDNKVESHFNTLIRGREFEKDLEEKIVHLDEVESFLGLRIYEEGSIGRIGTQHIVCKSLTGDLIAALVFDLPETVRTVSVSEAERWEISHEELLEIGKENIRRTYPPVIHERNIEGVTFFTLEAEHFFSPNIYFHLDLHPQLKGKGGTLMTFPTRQTVIAHAINNVESAIAVTHLIHLTRRFYDNGPGSLSNKVYWHQHGKFEVQPYEIAEDQISFQPTEDFVRMLNGIGKNQI